MARGAAAEWEQWIPFAAIASCLDLSQPVESDSPAPEHAALTAAVDLVRRWCARGPVALLLDDIQWADASSLSVLYRLGELIGELPLMVVVAMRPYPIGTGLPRLLSELDALGAQRIPLRPLSDDDVAQVIERAIGASPGPELLAAAAAGGGNPWYIIKLVTGLRASSAAGRNAEPDLPAMLADAVTRRLDFLPGPVRHVLEVAAALTPQVEAVDLAVVLGAPILEVWHAVRTAEQAGLLVYDGEDLIFAHDIVRRVLARQVPASVRTALLRHMATTLIARNASAERIARYVLADREPPGLWLLDWLAGAARTLVARSPAVAVELLGRALAVPGIDTATRDRLRPEWIRAMLRIGRPSAAAAALSAAQAETALSGAIRNELGRLSLELDCVRGRWHEVLDRARNTLSGNDLSTGDRSSYHCFAATALFHLERYDDARHQAEMAMAAGAAAGNLAAVRGGELVLAMLYYAAGQLDSALDRCERLIDAYRGGSAPADRWNLLVDAELLRGLCLIELDRLAEADTILEAVVSRAVSSNGMYVPLALMTHARVHFLAGRWDAALDVLDACLAARDTAGLHVAARGMAALIAIVRGVVPGEVIAEEDRTARGGRGYQQYRALAIAFEHESQGHPELGLRVLMDMLDAAASSGTATTLSDTYASVAKLAMQAGDTQAIEAVAAAAEKLVAIQPTASRRAVAWMCRGLADGCSELVERSMVAFAEAGRPAYAALAHESLALVLASSGRLEEARIAGGAAVERFLVMGAHWSAARATAQLRALGVRPGRRGPRRRPKSGWEALTVTEQRVAVLVAEGSSNAEIAEQMFLSRRTVQTHVSNILSKLGLNSRVQVAVAYAQRS